MNRFDLTSPSYEKKPAPIHSMNLMLQLKLCCFIAIASLQIRNIKADLCFFFFFKITSPPIKLEFSSWSDFKLLNQVFKTVASNTFFFF